MQAIIKGILLPHSRRAGKMMGISILPILGLGLFVNLIDYLFLADDVEYTFYEAYYGFGYVVISICIFGAGLLLLCIESSPKDTKFRFPNYYFLLPVSLGKVFALVYSWRVLIFVLYTIVLISIGEILYQPYSYYENTRDFYEHGEIIFMVTVITTALYIGVQGLAWASNMVRLNSMLSYATYAALFTLFFLGSIFVENNNLDIGVLVLCCIGAVLLSILLGYVGVRMQRSGTVLNSYVPTISIRSPKRGTAHTYRLFLSPMRAQIWYEFRRGYMFLPIAALVIIPVSILFLGVKDGGIVGFVYVLLHVIALAIGFLMDRRTTLYSNFALLRPQSTMDLALARIGGAALAIGCTFAVIALLSIPFQYELRDAFMAPGYSSNNNYHGVLVLLGALFHAAMLMGILVAGRIMLILFLGAAIGALIGSGIWDGLRWFMKKEYMEVWHALTIMACVALAIVATTPFLKLKEKALQPRDTFLNLLKCYPPLISFGIVIIIAGHLTQYRDTENLTATAIPLVTILTMIYYSYRIKLSSWIPIGTFLFIGACSAGLVACFLILIHSAYEMHIPAAETWTQSYIFGTLTGGMLCAALLSAPLITHWQRHS